MAKKFTLSSQQLKPDPTYNSKLVSKFINCLMLGGKKSVAQRTFYDAMDIISKKLKTQSPSLLSRESKGSSQTGARAQKKGKTGTTAPPKAEGTHSTPKTLEVFETAINKVKPMIEVRSKRVGGSSYQVPMQVSSKRQQSLAFRWILQSARSKKGAPMCERLAAELMDAYNERGGAMTTRENIHRMADANKAFAHFAW